MEEGGFILQCIEEFKIFILEKVWKVRKVSKHAIGLKLCAQSTSFELSKMPVFFLSSTREYWEDHSTKSHNQWPKKCSMAIRGNYLGLEATNRQLRATTQRQISLIGRKSVTNGDSSALICDSFKTGPQNTQLKSLQTLQCFDPCFLNIAMV